VGTIWTFLERGNMTVKKERPCGRAEPVGHSEAARSLVRGSARARPGAAHLHR
jgi:hypothetical protein